MYLAMNEDHDAWQGGYNYFTEDEMKCKGFAKGVCKCGGILPKHSYMLKLVKIREKTAKLLIKSGLDERYTINSGARCSEYNSKVSNTGKAGPHTEKLASDISCYGKKAFIILQAAISEGFTGIGVYQKGDRESRYLHLDLVEGINRPWIWSY